MNSTTELMLQLIGPAFLLFGAGMFLNQKYYLKAIIDLKENRFLIFFAAFINLVVGPAILIHHWMWGSLAEVVVTLFGISATIKGAHIVLAPKSWIKMAEGLVTENMLRYGSVAVIVIGVLVTYAGYFA